MYVCMYVYMPNTRRQSSPPIPPREGEGGLTACCGAPSPPPQTRARSRGRGPAGAVEEGDGSMCVCACVCESVCVCLCMCVCLRAPYRRVMGRAGSRAATRASMGRRAKAKGASSCRNPPSPVACTLAWYRYCFTCLVSGHNVTKLYNNVAAAGTASPAPRDDLC